MGVVFRRRAFGQLDEDGRGFLAAGQQTADSLCAKVLRRAGIEVGGFAQPRDQDPVEVEAGWRQQLDELALGARKTGCLEGAFDRAFRFLVEIVEDAGRFLGLGGADHERSFVRNLGLYKVYLHGGVTS